MGKKVLIAIATIIVAMSVFYLGYNAGKKDVNDILYGMYVHIIWSKPYKQMLLDGCKCNDFECLTIPNRRDSIVAYNLENSRSIIEFA